MIEQKEYFIKKTDNTCINHIGRLYTPFYIDEIGSNLHKFIYEDILHLSEMKVKDADSKFNIHPNSYIFLIKLAFLDFHSFTMGYYENIKYNFLYKYKIDRLSILKLKYIQFLLSVFKLITTKQELESYIKMYLNNSDEYPSSKIVETLVRFLNLEYNHLNKPFVPKADYQLLLNYYLQHRKDYN